MGKTEGRNNRIMQIMRNIYDKALTTEPVDDSEFSDSIALLFDTKVWGFREIALTVAVVMLDETDFPNFKASEDFYACKPRAIFEHPMKTVLIEKNLPHKQSGPLNVAKGRHKLDDDWVTNRRAKDKPTCKAAVNLIAYMEKHRSKVEAVAICLMRCLIAESKMLKKFDVKIEPAADPMFLFSVCKEMISNATDGGNTPQRICGYLLENFHKSMGTGIVVTGSNDSASTTSTTSKKPGDINEETKDGKILNVYEITVKPFNESRIRDSYNCLASYNEEHKTVLSEIIVICRPEDCHPNMLSSGLSGVMGSYEYNGVQYRYWNIFEWFALTLQHTPSSGRADFYQQLNEYISDISTSLAVKECWKRLHS